MGRFRDIKQYYRFSVLCFLVLVVIFVSSPVAQAGISVAPRRAIFRIDERNTQEIEVTNQSERPIRVRVETAQPPRMEEDLYLGDWVRLYPPILNLPPGDKRAVRFSVQPPEEVEDGEYRSLLFFEELPPEDERAEEGVEFSLLTRLGINIYGRYGEMNYEGELRDKEIETSGSELLIAGEFVNQGNAHLRMEVDMEVLKNGEVVAQAENPRFVIHRAAADTFEELIELPTEGGEEVRVTFRRRNGGGAIYQFVSDI